jgi:hypothetical protein
MRHVLAQLAVSPLAQRVQQPAPPALLVLPSRCALPASPRSSRARWPAVPPPRHVAHRAQRDGAPAVRVPANDDVQRDHGPRRRGARHPRGPVRPKTGRSATSRSGGAIEGTEALLSVPSLCLRRRRRYRGLEHAGDDVAAIAQSPRRGDWCSSPRSVMTTYAAINRQRRWDSISRGSRSGSCGPGLSAVTDRQARAPDAGSRCDHECGLPRCIRRHPPSSVRAPRLLGRASDRRSRRAASRDALSPMASMAAEMTRRYAANAGRPPKPMKEDHKRVLLRAQAWTTMTVQHAVAHDRFEPRNWVRSST